MRSSAFAFGCVLVCLGPLVGSELSYARPSPLQPLAAIKFDFLKNEVVASVRINGKGPFTVLLDTGTAPSVIDLSVARKIGLKLETASGPSEGGGTEAHLTYSTSLPDVVLGKLTTAKVEALATDLSGLTPKIGRQIDGVLGDSFFSNRVIQFDYSRKIAKVYSRSPISRPHPVAREITVPFQHEDGEVHFSGLRINGKTVKANLDTGSNGTFSLTPSGIERLGLVKQASKGQARSASGFNGKYNMRKGTLDLVEFGNYRIYKPEVIYWQRNTGHDSRNWDVNVGNLFLKNFVVTVDYQANQLTLTRR